MENISPGSRQEQIALFRAQVLGALLHSERHWGELRPALQQVSLMRLRPPGSNVTRSYSVTTLERWLYAWREGGLSALMPKQRSDKGRGRALPESLVTLIR